jgi:orotate phosphoribosyltransferase
MQVVGETPPVPAPAERVLVVEDVITTGLSTRETIEVASAAGAEVVGAAALVDRSAGQPALGVPFRALLAVELPTWEPATCPLCARGIEVVKPGSRPARQA